MASNLGSILRELATFVGRLVRRSGKDRILVSASSLAFHWFIALVPGAIALIGMANLAGLKASRLQSLTHGISVLLPGSAANVFDQALTTRHSGTSNLSAVVIGGLVALWASLEAAATLQIAFDMVYETQTDRGFIQRRIRGLPIIAITLLFGGGAFALLIIGEPVGSLVQPSGGGSWFPAAWTAIRWIVGIVLVVVLISLYNYFAPNRTEREWRLLSVGGSVSTALWILVAAGYSFYLNHFGHGSQTYGAFSGVVALLLWLYLTGAVILVGAELNREVERAHTSTTGHKDPSSRSPYK